MTDAERLAEIRKSLMDSGIDRARVWTGRFFTWEPTFRWGYRVKKEEFRHYIRRLPKRRKT